jgi:hypothetical protein
MVGSAEYAAAPKKNRRRACFCIQNGIAESRKRLFSVMPAYAGIQEISDITGFRRSPE